MKGNPRSIVKYPIMSLYGTTAFLFPPLLPDGADKKTYNNPVSFECKENKREKEGSCVRHTKLRWNFFISPIYSNAANWTGRATTRIRWRTKRFGAFDFPSE